MKKKYSDDIRLNDDAEFTMTVEGDFSKLYEALGIEVPKKNLYTDELKEACDTVVENLKNINRIMDQIMTEAVCKSPLVIRVRKEDIKNEDILAQIKEQETANLKEACAIIEHYEACFNAPAEVCWGKTCKACEHYIDSDIAHRAINQLLDHAKKSLENTEAK